jgi:hypothetical protein
VHTAFIIALMMKAVHTSETTFYFNEITQPCIPEGCHLYKTWFVIYMNVPFSLFISVKHGAEKMMSK